MKTKTTACIFAILAAILLSHSAFAEPAKITTKDTNQAKATAPAKKGRNISINLFESMTLDSGDKKPVEKIPDKKTAAKKTPKKAEPKKPTPKKPITKKTMPKKPIKTVSKIKHDTVKNSISNVR